MRCARRLTFGFDCDSPELFVTSEWQKRTKPSVKFLIYRWAITTYFNFVLILSLFTAGDCGQLSFHTIYLTNWNVMLNAFSSLFGAILVTLYYQKKIKFNDERKQMPTSFKAYWLLATLSTVVSISLSCVYWPLIYNGRDKGLNDSLTHAGNAIVFLVDIFINAHPPRFGHFIYPLSFGILYAFVFSLPYTLLGGTDRDLNNFIYSVLDWVNKTSGALTFAVATIVFLTFMHFVLTFLAVTRINLHNHTSSRSTINPRVNQSVNQSPQSVENINQAFEQA